MQKQLETLRQRLQDLRRVSALPYWRSSFADFLLERTQEYIAVGREPEAKGVMARVEAWLERQEATARKPHGAGALAPQVKLQLWRQQDLERVLARLRSELQARRALIPTPEREALITRLDRVEKALQKGHLEEAKGELNAVRVAWIRRLTRSYRAWSTQPRSVGGFGMPARNVNARMALVPTGPYNTRRNIEDMMRLVGERDPIWVEDLMEVYHDLFQYVERLSDPDKKKRR